MPAASSEKIVCPKCGFEQYKRSAICKKCGLIFDKWREQQARKQRETRVEPALAEADDGTQTAIRPGVLLFIIACALIAAVLFFASRGEAPRSAPQAPPVTAEAPPAPPAAPAGPATPELAGPVVVPRDVPSGLPADGTASAVPSSPVTLDEAYVAYLDDLAKAVGVLERFEAKLLQGISFKDMKLAYLQMRSDLAQSFRAQPDPRWLSHLALEKAATAYGESLKFWEYRTFSSEYQGRLWCPGGTCPFETEQGLRDAIGGFVKTAWNQASLLRKVAARFAEGQYADPSAFEADPEIKAEIELYEQKITELWRSLRQA